MADIFPDDGVENDLTATVLMEDGCPAKVYDTCQAINREKFNNLLIAIARLANIGGQKFDCNDADSLLNNVQNHINSFERFDPCGAESFNPATDVLGDSDTLIICDDGVAKQITKADFLDQLNLSPTPQQVCDTFALLATRDLANIFAAAELQFPKGTNLKEMLPFGSTTVSNSFDEMDVLKGTPDNAISPECVDVYYDYYPNRPGPLGVPLKDFLFYAVPKGSGEPTDWPGPYKLLPGDWYITQTTTVDGTNLVPEMIGLYRM